MSPRATCSLTGEVPEGCTANDDGTPARCSYCARSVDHVAVLPLAQRPELEERIRVGLSGEMWVGLCAYCVLAIAEALAAAHAREKVPA